MVIISSFLKDQDSRWKRFDPSAMKTTGSKTLPSSPYFHLQFCNIPSASSINLNLAHNYLHILLSAWGDKNVPASQAFTADKMARLLASSSFIVNAYLPAQGKAPLDDTKMAAFLLVKRLYIRDKIVDHIRFLAIKKEQQFSHLGTQIFLFLDNLFQKEKERFISADIVNPSLAGLISRRKKLLVPNIDTGKIPKEWQTVMTEIAAKESPGKDIQYDAERGLLPAAMGGSPALCWGEEASIPWDRDPKINAIFKSAFFPPGKTKHDGTAILMLWEGNKSKND